VQKVARMEHLSAENLVVNLVESWAVRKAAPRADHWAACSVAMSDVWSAGWTVGCSVGKLVGWTAGNLVGHWAVQKVGPTVAPMDDPRVVSTVGQTVDCWAAPRGECWAGSTEHLSVASRA